MRVVNNIVSDIFSIFFYRIMFFIINDKIEYYSAKKKLKKYQKLRYSRHAFNYYHKFKPS